MPTIPSGLKPVVDGYAFGSPDGVMRTEVAGGMPRYGLEWDRGVQQFRVSLMLDSLQFSVWTTFFHHTIKRGALAFDMALDSGYGAETHSVTIVPGSLSSARAEGEVTRVSFSVDAESSAYAMTEAEALAAVAAYEAALGASLLRLLRPIISGYAFDSPHGIERTAVAGGAPRTGMAVDRAPQGYRVTLVLNGSQFAIWTTYFLHVAKKGVIPFEMYLDSGFGEEAHTVNVMPGTYSATRAGVLWTVTFGAEAESSVYGMTAAQAEALLELYEALGAIVVPLLRRIDKFANHDTLVLP